jgi:hypothetical protein
VAIPLTPTAPIWPVFCGAEADTDRQSGSTENMPTQLPAKILQIHTVANSSGIQETFVN